MIARLLSTIALTISITVSMPQAGLCQCVTDSFTIDNFGDYVTVDYSAAMLPPCDMIKKCQPCKFGNIISLPPFVQDVEVLSLTGLVTSRVILMRDCHYVHMDTCVKMSPNMPFRMHGDMTSGDWSLMFCVPNGTMLRMRSVPWLLPFTPRPLLYGAGCAY